MYMDKALSELCLVQSGLYPSRWHWLAASFRFYHRELNGCVKWSSQVCTLF